ncbi:MAG TPA: T9SS type A sorting domain-containing protein [Edaphocola sp.]|nr:T9SS type A sorting domain-containing protein [Edaphocola sp.]
MKNKVILFSAAMAVSMLLFNNTNAQISQGGLPLSLTKKTVLTHTPVSSYSNPDWNAYLDQEKSWTPEEAFVKPYLVGLHATTDFGFPYSGQFESKPDGQMIWRGSIEIIGAPAIGLLFDNFELPKGVKVFVINANGKQISGAYDHTNNDPSKKFVIDAVQGDKIFIELNIEANVNPKDISFHIDRALVYHRAIEHLKVYTIAAGNQPLDQLDSQLNGLSSVCTINAICPSGTNYSNSRKATVQTIDASKGSLCSATLVNNTGNTTTNCKPLLVTATHCEGSGSLTNNTYNQWLVRFNFERPDCAGTGATNAVSMTGLNILARADYTDALTANQIDGDFMAFEFRQKIPASYGAVLSGWKNSNNIATSTSGQKKFIGFHHPHGDNKKLTTSSNIMSVDLGAGTISANGTRWLHNPTEGYAAPGSSGSGLFNENGYFIGIASVAGEQNPPAGCKVNSSGQQAFAMDVVFYQKLSHAWDYSSNGQNANRKLKPWLDPNNTNTNSLNSVSSNCSPLNTGGGVSINNINKDLESQLNIFPNPSTDGIFNLQYNLSEATDLDIQIIDVTGRTLSTKSIKQAKSGISTINLDNVSNGLYIVKINTKRGFTSKKLMVSK